MRAIVMSATGAPDVLTPREIDDPTPGDGQVLVRAAAVPVLYPETKVRAGAFPFPAPLPAVFGFQAAGTIVDLGAGVDPALLGVRVVAATSGFGAYAELVAAEQGSVTIIPDGLGTEAAAAIQMPGSVALALIATAALTPGETVLVEAGATGVGSCLVQLCAARGVRVIATAGGADKAALARAHGAATVLDHSAPDWADRLGEALSGGTVDVVFDSIGGDSLTPLLDHVTPLRGRILSYGWLAGAPARLGAADLILRGLTLTGCAGAAWLDSVATQRAAALDAAARGLLTVPIDAALPLDAAADAHRKLEDRTAFGAVLLLP
ncbi:quinone oxidoreductase family protein [Nocardia neocaledoniensis]|uniref:quinone oxidoreductase family protein n=1 Tax=Nocardia neocaledoniensis TaxID=236511 RepID=UPI002458A4D0|nr:zinc-binding dehydrogenase [Nocardia neocaledoniensis]